MPYLQVMRTIHFSDGRSSLKTVIDRVVDDADVTLVTRRDAPNAVILSQEYPDSLRKTVQLLRSPADVARLECSIAQLRNGKLKEHKLTGDDERALAACSLLPTRGTITFPRRGKTAKRASASTRSFAQPDGRRSKVSANLNR